MAVQNGVSIHDVDTSLAGSRTSCPSFPFARQHGIEPPAENAEFRHHDPVSKVKLFDGTEAWVVAKHEDIRSALGSDKLSAVSHYNLHPLGNHHILCDRLIPYLGSTSPWLS